MRRRAALQPNARLMLARRCELRVVRRAWHGRMLETGVSAAAGRAPVESRRTRRTVRGGQRVSGKLLRARIYRPVTYVLARKARNACCARRSAVALRPWWRPRVAPYTNIGCARVGLTCGVQRAQAFPNATERLGRRRIELGDDLGRERRPHRVEMAGVRQRQGGRSGRSGGRGGLQWRRQFGGVVGERGP